MMLKKHYVARWIAVTRSREMDESIISFFFLHSNFWGGGCQTILTWFYRTGTIFGGLIKYLEDIRLQALLRIGANVCTPTRALCAFVFMTANKTK